VKTPSLRHRFLSNKVADVNATFWVLKVLTTAMGEATSDFLVHRFAPVLAVVAGGVVFLAVLWWQLTTPTYRVMPYWSAVVMVSVFGTMCADVVHVQFLVPYVVSASAFSVVLAIVFLWWYQSERTLSIHSITTTRREIFYWASVTTTFALGTAVGDLTAYTLGWGFFVSGVVFALLIMMPALGYRLTRLNGVVAFWWAYVLTRPLGASFADWFGVSPARDGLNWGPGTVGLSLSALIVLFVARLARRETMSTTS
jgi:uncharacterized membrane-anchored protein